MEAKKTPKADLENRIGLHLEIGLVVVLAAVLVAFNVRKYEKEAKDVIQRTAMLEVEEEILNTVEDTPPPPPEPEPETVVTDLTVIDNNEEIHNEVGIISAEVNENTAVQAVAPVVVDEEVVEEEEEIFLAVEEDPEFPGGLDALSKYLGENIKYPALAKENNIEGRVFVSFVVEKDGRVANVKILRDIGGGCGAEAVRVVKAMPKWKPGKQRGKPVRTQFNLPVQFGLQ